VFSFTKQRGLITKSEFQINILCKQVLVRIGTCWCRFAAVSLDIWFWNKA